MFKNVAKLIDASVFSKSNNYVLQHQNLRLCPSSQFFSDEQVGNLSPFNAAVLALGFSTQHHQLTKFLKLPEPTLLFVKQCSLQQEASKNHSN